MRFIMRPTNVSNVYIADISEENLLNELENGLKFINSNEIIGNNFIIFIKPNLTDYVHKPGITTTPFMIEKVIELFSPLVKKIFVGESDGGNYSFYADTSLKNHGVFDVAGKFLEC